MWNGVNYLLKMPTDLDFVARLRPVVSWLGFNMERNPFVVPMSLDFRVPTPGPHAMRKAFAPSRDSFHSIGGSSNVPAVIAEVDEQQGESTSAAAAGDGGGGADMAATAKAYGSVGPANNGSSPKSADQQRIEILRMMPSQVCTCLLYTSPSPRDRG